MHVDRYVVMRKENEVKKEWISSNMKGLQMIKL